MKKRTAALLLVGFVAVLVGGSLAVLRTRWAADRLCTLAASRIERAAGMPLAIAACRIRPLSLELRAEGIRLGPADAPVFQADLLEARLAPVQVLGPRLRFERVRLVRPRVAYVQKEGAGSGGTCRAGALSRFEIRRLEVEDGAAEVSVPGGTRVRVGRFDVHTVPVRSVLRFLGGARPRTRLALTAGPVDVETPGRAVTASRVAAEVELALDLAGAEISSAEADIGGFRIGLQGSVDDLCAPKLDLVATASGPLADALARMGLREPAEGTARVELRVTGRARTPDLRAKLSWKDARIAGFRPGTGTAELRLAGTAIAVERVELPFEGGKAVLRGAVQLARGLPVRAEVETHGVDLGEVLDRLGVRRPWITVRLDARASLSGTLAPPVLSGTVSSEVADLRALTRPYQEARGDPGIIAFRRGRLESAVRVDRQGLVLDGARLTVGRGTLGADANVAFSNERGFSLRCRGQADLDALGRVGTIPWGGLATVEASVGAAPYGNPRITGHTRIERFRFLDIDLGTASADLAYESFVLRIRSGEGVRNVSRYHGEADVDLRASQVISSRFQAKGRLRDLFEAVLDWVPRTRYVRDAMDGDVEVAGTASGPASALDAEFRAKLGAGTVWGRRYDGGHADGHVSRGEEVRFDAAELRRGAGAVRAAGTWGFRAPFPWALQLDASGMPLSDLGLPGSAWSGTLAGRADLAGSYEHPRVRFAGSADAVQASGIAAGTVQLGGKIDDRKLVATASADGAWIETEVALEGDMPFRARGGLPLQDVTRFLPGLPSGVRLRIAGQATAEGTIEQLALARAHVRLDTVQAGYGDFRVEGAGPAAVEVDRGRIELQALLLRGTNTELALSGSRAASGILDLTATGALDLRLLGGVAPVVRRPAGRLTLEAHVGGTSETPVLVGSGRVEDAGFEVRGTTIVFSGMRGDLAFSQNRVLFDGLRASVNGGRARLQGEVQLASFTPSRLRVEAELDEVPVAIPAYLPATLTGRIEAAGTPDATVVSGRLHVVRARYAANVDLDRSVLELRRRPLPPPRAYDKAGEWLRFDLQLVVDGDARVENDLVRGVVSGALTLTGTLAAPGLVGTLSMAEGSRAVFRGNEFRLTHAVLDFTDRHKVVIGLDVHGESQVRDYQIFMHVLGTIDEPQVTLTSAPALSQPDIITLLSLGFTRRDAAAGTGVGGVATAAAAQALFSASGLDEQVKRFVPRGGVMRDLSVRITSGYSESTGQVEPRAEFESWLLRDRLRLRYQAPLAGARGQKAEAELRVGDHTAVQYQWNSDSPEVATGDHGVDLKLRWEWNDRR